MRAWHTYAAMRAGESPRASKDAPLPERGRAENPREVGLTETHSQRKPGRLGAAEARLDAALGRIEAALEGVAGELAARADRAAAEAQARLRAEEERAGDRAALAQLREENAALQHTRDLVSGRLDAAVERLRQALAH